MSYEHIEGLFTYVPPTETTLPLFKRVGKAEMDAYVAIREVFEDLPDQDYQPAFTVITENIKLFGHVIDDVIADGWNGKTVALDALVVARASFNDALVTNRKLKATTDTNLVLAFEERMRLAYEMGVQNLMQARLLTCYVITFAHKEPS